MPSKPCKLKETQSQTVKQRNLVEDKYVAVSASVIIWVPKSGESKSGQMVSEKVIWS